MAEKMLALELLGVSDGKHAPVVLLRHQDRVLPIVVGTSEAQAIQMGLMGHKIGRPMTHDLIGNILAGLGGELQSVTIYKLEHETFFAHLNIVQKGVDGDVEQVLRIDSRPSDGIAIAVRQDCPLYAAVEVMNVAGQELSIIGGEDSDHDLDEEDTDEDEDDTSL